MLASHKISPPPHPAPSVITRPGHTSHTDIRVHHCRSHSTSLSPGTMPPAWKRTHFGSQLGSALPDFLSTVWIRLGGVHSGGEGMAGKASLVCTNSQNYFILFNAAYAWFLLFTLLIAYVCFLRFTLFIKTCISFIINIYVLLLEPLWIESNWAASWMQFIQLFCCR